MRNDHDGMRKMIYDFRSGRPVAYDASGGATELSKEFKFNQSILSQDRGFYGVIAIARLFQDIKLYADMGLGRFTAARKPQNTDLDPSFLEEDASNLALVLNYLDSKPGVMNAIVEKLKLFYERVKDIKTTVFGNTIMVYLEESGLRHTIPATRLSDGTLRFLCLLTILCHPKPPPIVCIEEPELGMHPDIIPTIADLLIEASQRTQLIVTTHSDLLVSKLRDVPESLLVCERGENGTTMRRLDAKELESWPEDYSLGEIWLKGAIGGTRW
jgi:predicted ATPase